MSNPASGAVDAPTQFVEANGTTYAYRRFGMPMGAPLLCLQHFTGTLDNWDPAVADPLAAAREVILFENAGVGRSTGSVPDTVAGMAAHALAFIDALGLAQVDVLGYSLGGMVAQQMVKDRPSLIRRMVLVGTAPRGGEEIMHLDKPELAKHFADPSLKGYDILQKIFFTPSEPSQAAGAAFTGRLMQRQADREPQSGGEVIQAQMASFRHWEVPDGERFADLLGIWTPTLIVNGVADEMIPVRNSYWLVENLPNAVLLVFPDAGHGSLFQYHAAFTRHVAAFLASDDDTAAF
jgi:pimeloyl-ACP methyl ester carboxylesterase